MSTRKILSVALASTLVGSSLLPGITHAKINVWGAQVSTPELYNSSYTSSRKIQWFLRAEKKVLDYMTKDYKKTVITLKNANAKRAYTAEYMDIADSIKEVFSNAEYDSDYMLSYHMDALKKEIGAYKTLRRELVSLNGSANNPFSIPAQETASIETDMIDFQKIVTTVAKQALDNYDSSDFKETGKMNMAAEGSFGKVDLSIEKYTKILSLLTRSQEADMTAKATFSFNTPGSYEYNEKTDDYEKTPGKTVSGDFSIDGSMKVIDQDLYLTLRDYSLNIANLTPKEKEKLDKDMKEFAQYKGKTVKISLPSSSDETIKINQAEIISQLKKTLAILEENSLFTPYKKIGDTYTLNLKDSTLQSIAAVYDQKVEATDIVQAKKDMRKIPLLYSTASGKKTLFVQIKEPQAVGIISLSNEAGKYRFLLDIKNPIKKGTDIDTESAYLLIDNNGTLKGKLQVPDANIDVDYRNQTLSVVADIKDGSSTVIKIEGPLSDENTNLNFVLNNEKIGNVTWKKIDDTYTYDVLFETTIMEVLSKFHMNGESTVTKGKFPIVAPKDAVEIEDPYTSQLKKVRDSQRMSDINYIWTWILVEQAKQWKYPKSLNDLPQKYTSLQDPRHGQTISWCTFGYIYKPSPKQDSFTLSTCLEDKNNIEEKAKNDWGTDPLRWEISSETK